MKNFFILIIICFLSPVFAEDEVYLDLNTTETHQYKTFTPSLNNEMVEKSDEFDTDMILHPFKYIQKEFFELKTEEKK